MILLCSAANIQLSGQEIDLLMLNNQNEKALRSINEKLAADSLQPELYLKKAIILQRQFDYAGAIHTLTKAYQIDSTRTDIWSELAESFNSLGNYEDATRFYEKICQTDPANIVQSGKLARSYIASRVYDKAFAILSKIYQSDSTNVFFNKQLAYCAYNTSKDSMATYLYHKVIQQNPRDISSYHNLSAIYQKQELANEAIAILEKGLRVFPENGGLLIRLANNQFENKMYHEARLSYQLWLQKNYSVPDVRKRLGIVFYFEKVEREALRLLESYYQLAPDDPMASFYIGLCYKNLADYGQSIDFINLSIELSRPPYLSDLYHHLGSVYGQARRFKEAIESLQKSYELDSSKNEILFDIATTYEEFQQDKRPALQYYKAYLASGIEGKSLSRQMVEYTQARIRKIEEELFFEEGIKDKIK